MIKKPSVQNSPICRKMVSGDTAVHINKRHLIVGSWFVRLCGFWSSAGGSFLYHFCFGRDVHDSVDALVFPVVFDRSRLHAELFVSAILPNVTLTRRAGFFVVRISESHSQIFELCLHRLCLHRLGNETQKNGGHKGKQEVIYSTGGSFAIFFCSSFIIIFTQ